MGQSCQDAWDNVHPVNKDIAPPTYTSTGLVQQGRVIVDVTNKNWQSSSAPLKLKANKLVTLTVSDDGLYAPPAKYSVLYRIDPRFSRPQVFISNIKNSSINYDINSLENTLSNNSYSFLRKIDAMNGYFNFTNRQKIFVKSGQILNIMLSSGSFSNPNPDPTSINPIGVYTNNAITNQIIYTNTSNLCAKLLTTNSTLMDSCISNIFTINPSTDKTFFGIPSNTSNISSVASSCNSVDKNKICTYNKGIGMIITFNGNVIKDANTSFVKLTENKYIFRYQATNDGFLDFIDQGVFSTSGMFLNLPNSLTTYWSNYENAVTTFNAASILNFLYFGSYLMDIEIGGTSISKDPTANSMENDISLYYKISNSPPNPTDNGTLISFGNARFDAPDGGGSIWFKVTNDTTITGNIQINYAGYTQSTPVADFLLNKLIIPLSDSFKTLSSELFLNISSSKLMFFPTVQSALTLYVVIYTLFFLGGSIKITTTELVKVIAKIGVVAFLLSNVNSWNYFNTNLFQIFFGGADYLINSTINITSSKGNIFGFIDPLIDFYFNSDVWWLIFIEFVSFWQGTTIFAVLLIITILNLTILLLDIVIKYILAILSICVLISLAPLFIILILFQTTRPVFNNWISSLVCYVIEPFFMFVFFLMIQQIIMTLLPSAIPGATWKQLVDLNIYFSLGGHTFSIPIVGCPGIAFYQVHNINFMTLMSNTFIVFCLSLVSVGLLNYTKAISSLITGTQGLPSIQFSPSSTLSKTIGMSDINQSWGIEKKPSKSNDKP